MNEKICTSLFLKENYEWMGVPIQKEDEEEEKVIEGKINCPSCKKKIGK